MNTSKCATSDTAQSWTDIDFSKAEKCVKKLQKRIAEAFNNDEVDRVISLQHKMIHSFYAKALAVKSVTSNRGKKTSGVDDVVWVTPEDKYNAIFQLNRRGYKPMPLKRIYIPKVNGKMRPLSIPTMKDRAMHTLYRYALEPISEVTADCCSFAYRSKRSAKDAIIQIVNVLTEHPEYQWVMKADIKACFDNISHEWVIEHIPMDKVVLWKFLKCGYIEESVYHPTERGVPQGGCISSVICNMTLDGLEELLNMNFGRSVCLTRYADDIIIVGESQELLVQMVVPVLNEFLSERGLALSKEKTGFYSVNDKIHFLGWEISMVDGKIIAKPTREKVDSLLGKVKDVLMHPQEEQECELNWRIRGWLNYYAGIAHPLSLNDVEYEIYLLIYGSTGDNRFAELVRDIFSRYESCY